MNIIVLTNEPDKYKHIENYQSSLIGNIIKTDDYETIFNFSDINCILVDDTIDNILQVCEILYKNTQIPIIKISEKEDLKSQCLAFDVGCYDYIVEPFSIELLLRKVNVHTRNKKDNLVVDLPGDVRINKRQNLVSVKDSIIDLTSRQFEILSLLLDNANNTVSRDQIIKTLWCKDIKNKRIVDTHIKNIRRLIPSVKIDTVNGIGYRIVANID